MVSIVGFGMCVIARNPSGDLLLRDVDESFVLSHDEADGPNEVVSARSGGLVEVEPGILPGDDDERMCHP
jgi:hypothetical protein